MLDAEINQKELDKLIPKFKRALDKAHLDTAQEVWGNLMEFSPVDTGRLASSWRLEHKGPRESIVATNVQYALAQSDGSGPYIIKPKRAKALRFVINGNVIFAKKVNHPGLKGNRYIDRAVDATNARVEEFVQNALDSEGLT